MDFQIVGEIAQIETIASGSSVRDRVPSAEIHWYEAHGIGKLKFKLKLPFLDRP